MKRHQATMESLVTLHALPTGIAKQQTHYKTLVVPV